MNTHREKKKDVLPLQTIWMMAKYNVSYNPTNRLTFKAGCKFMCFMWVCHKEVPPRLRGNIMVSNYLNSWIARNLSFAYKTDSLCLARTLVTDIARQDKDPESNSIRQGRKEQRLLAQQLHKKAGVLEGLCGIPEVDKFQKVIDNY